MTSQNGRAKLINIISSQTEAPVLSWQTMKPTAWLSPKGPNDLADLASKYENEIGMN